MVRNGLCACARDSPTAAARTHFEPDFFLDPLSRRMCTVKSAQEYRTRAAELDSSADACGNYEQMLQMEAVAREWRKLAGVAEWQDAMLSALAATRD
jgi:hypothetical protein